MLKNLKPTVDWSEIESLLSNLEAVAGGFSSAKRGVVKLENGQRVFVKIGVTEESKAWIKKEIEVYNFLLQNNFKYIPDILSINKDQTSFALEILEIKDGWDWTSTWTNDRIEATLKCLNELADIDTNQEILLKIEPVVSTLGNGWVELKNSEEKISTLRKKLVLKNRVEILEHIDKYAELTSEFDFNKEFCVHNDVRADNCPWNFKTNEIKLIDWNWFELGDRRIDLAALFVHVEQSGFPLEEKYLRILDLEALEWLSGIWLAAASKPIWPGGPDGLREMQLVGGIVALDLSNRIKMLK